MDSHQMIMLQQYPDGSREWFCPACHRRFVMHDPPQYQKVILEAGNESATHTGATGAVRVNVEVKMSPRFCDPKYCNHTGVTYPLYREGQGLWYYCEDCHSPYYVPDEPEDVKPDGSMSLKLWAALHHIDLGDEGED